ncbi:MAG TPA: zinc-finger domain-containing protein [Micavibrio sp.]
MAAQQQSPVPEIIIVDADADEVCCNGGSPVLGHPVVWYAFADRDRVECGYCDRIFIKQS